LHASIPTECVIPKCSVALGKYNYGVLVKHLAYAIKSGIEQRDAAVKTGALGATTLLYIDRKFVIPLTGYDSLRNEISRLKTDSDNDGVADYLDKCPNTPDSVKVDGSGCPLPKLQPPPPPQQTVVITEEDKRVVNEAIKNLQFDFGKATIKASSDASLDRVAQILINKNFSLKLAGHTDNVGSDDANMKLSKDRAEAVKDYLVSKGANPSRIEATGYGETQPIASNKTAEGRAKNRRVEFTLY